MNEYELLVSEVQKKAPVIETDLFQNTGCYGLYRDGRIYIEKSLSLSEKRNVLAEELGHHDTSFGDILNQDCLENRKQELRARQYALEQPANITTTNNKKAIDANIFFIFKTPHF